MKPRISLVLRNPKISCMLADKLAPLIGGFEGRRGVDCVLEESAVHSESETFEKQVRFTSTLYLGNMDMDAQVGGRSSDNLELKKLMEDARDEPYENKILMVHPRSELNFVGIEKVQYLPYHLHIFCDDTVFLMNSNHTMLSSRQQNDRAYTENVAKKLIMWLEEEKPRRGIRSGTFVNMTRGLNGAVIAGVMTGGTKEPLGSCV